ncbi:protein trichome birefringence-like [Medicago truncatula]|uniref:protein trichome birefringence-like n=1 Tax=Medicago truncatula TaxID=3880 RepID=UPI000D2F4557|nr:protein trichome birefringence-like [Medicago truncatula]
MVDSPACSRKRLLTRTDSIRFVPSRGGAMIFTYSFTFASILFMLFLVNAFHPSNRHHFSKVFSHIFNNSSSFSPPPSYTPQYSTNETTTHDKTSHSSNKDTELVVSSRSSSQISRKEGSGLAPKQSNQNDGQLFPQIASTIKPQQDKSFAPMPSPNARVDSKNVIQSDEHLRNNCDIYEGSWVLDDSFPLYKSGSCPHIDEPFNCFLNGRRDNKYEKFRWQPKNCNMPRYI